MKTTQEMIEVMQAAVEGKEIECLPLDGLRKWRTSVALAWDWQRFEYRVKKPEEPRQLTAVRYPSVGFCFPSLQAQPGDGDTIEFIELTPDVRLALLNYDTREH